MEVKSIPSGELVPTYVWFVCQLGILLVAAIAVWNRPFDRAARLFLLMCALATFAFVGGFHWWVIAATPWLNLPFAIGGAMLAAVTLHFFLMFPRPRAPFVESPWATLIVVYGPSLVTAAAIVVCLVGVRLVHGAEEPNPAAVIAWIDALRFWIRAYLAVAGLTFVCTLTALAQGYISYRTPVERNQLRWILGAALLATGPILYTVHLAAFRRVEFATGHGRIPMLVASLAFMLAYAVAMVRYRLMSAYEFVTRSTLYYVVSSVLTLGLAIGVTAAVLSATGLPATMTPQQGRSLVAILVLAVVLLVWLRDRVQSLADRHFFSEKYRLDEAFQRMNPVASREVDSDALGDRLLETCREVLRVEWACLHLLQEDGTTFIAVAEERAGEVPKSFELDASDVTRLRSLETVLRVRGEPRNETDTIQLLLGEVGADLLHVLEVEGHVAGLLFLGRKQSGASFTGEDATFLHALGQIASVGFYGSKVHHELARRDDELRAKLEIAARQQRQIAILQAELRSLDPPRTTVRPADGELLRNAIKGDGPAISAVLQTVRKVADSDATVLVRGESGTGKELLAQVLHDNSPRREKNLVRVNCAALSPTLLESELFGHVRGAFTGADRDRVGRFEMANGGTLFLDEIGDISLETQVKLLRVVQERRFERVGGTESIDVDVRLVTATHQHLERLIREGRFREDLYYRLNVVSVTLPALRERVDDLPELVFHFLHETARRTGKRVRDVDENVWDVLESFDWPGNIRQLRNVVERAVVLAEADVLTVADLPEELLEHEPTRRSVGSPTVERGRNESSRVEFEPAGGTLVSTDEDDEPTRLAEALRRSDGNKARAARMLGMPRSTYYSKLKKYGIDG